MLFSIGLTERIYYEFSVPFAVCCFVYYEHFKMYHSTLIDVNRCRYLDSSVDTVVCDMFIFFKDHQPFKLKQFSMYQNIIPG